MVHKSCLNLKVFMFSAILFLMHGCVSMNQYGSIIPARSKGDVVAIEEIIKEWQNFNIYYADVNPAYPSAILIDPKWDERHLTNARWIAVKEKDELTELVKWIDLNINFPPDLSAVLGPDKQVFGYMYTGWTHVLIKVVDDKTLWVDDSPLPVIELDDNFLPGE